MEAAQARLTSFTQRLSFAKRRVETVQGLVVWSLVGLQFEFHMIGRKSKSQLFFLHRVDHEEGGSAESAAGR